MNIFIEEKETMRKLCYFAAILCLGVFLASGVQADLVAHYTFEEGSGTTAADSSGYGNAANGAFVGAGVSWVAGKVGNSAVNVDGTSWIDCGNDSKFNITGQISISAWIKAGTVMFPQGGDTVCWFPKAIPPAGVPARWITAIRCFLVFAAMK